MSAAQLATLIRERQPCVALTGAGVSTESGIPDFRSPTGIWADVDPLEYGSLEAFRRDPAKVWSFYAPRFAMLTDAEPNAAHRALAELERRGLVRAVVTQNIDVLHERAGSREVLEVHGSIKSSSCPDCGASYPLAAVEEQLQSRDAPVCSCGAILKPDVVFFGEVLPAASHRPGLCARCRSGAAARRRVRARGLAGRRASARHAPCRRRGGDRQPRPDRQRRGCGAEDRRIGRRDARERRRRARRCLGCGSAQQALVEHPLTGLAHLLLDLERHSRALSQKVGDDRAVAVSWRFGGLAGHCLLSG